MGIEDSVGTRTRDFRIAYDRVIRHVARQLVDGLEPEDAKVSLTLVSPYRDLFPSATLDGEMSPEDEAFSDRIIAEAERVADLDRTFGPTL